MDNNEGWISEAWTMVLSVSAGSHMGTCILGSPLTTLNSSGSLPIERQAEIIKNLGQKMPTAAPNDDMAERIEEKLAKMLGHGDF